MIPVPPFYQNYVAKTSTLSLKDALEFQFEELLAPIESADPKIGSYAYAPEKWTVNEVLQHVIDTERIFVYRALCISRGEKKDLPGFEQDEYAAEMNVEDASVGSIIKDFRLCRKATIAFFESLSPKHLSRVGKANSHEMTAEMIGRILSGHALHHLQIINERYLS